MGQACLHHIPRAIDIDRAKQFESVGIRIKVDSACDMVKLVGTPQQWIKIGSVDNVAQHDADPWIVCQAS